MQGLHLPSLSFYTCTELIYVTLKYGTTILPRAAHDSTDHPPSNLIDLHLIHLMVKINHFIARFRLVYMFLRNAPSHIRRLGVFKAGHIVVRHVSRTT